MKSKFPGNCHFDPATKGQMCEKITACCVELTRISSGINLGKSLKIPLSSEPRVSLDTVNNIQISNGYHTQSLVQKLVAAHNFDTITRLNRTTEIGFMSSAKQTKNNK